jgi:hypothetical protein
MREIIGVWGSAAALRAKEALQALIADLDRQPDLGYGAAEPLDRLDGRYDTLALPFDRSPRRLLSVYDPANRVLDVLGAGVEEHARDQAFSRTRRRLRLTSPTRDRFGRIA